MSLTLGDGNRELRFVTVVTLKCWRHSYILWRRVSLGGCQVSISGNSRNGSSHPFLKKDPKPTRARLVSLLDPLGRKRYGEVERFLATVNGASSGLFYYGTTWGWAVPYQLGIKNTLCTL